LSPKASYAQAGIDRNLGTISKRKDSPNGTRGQTERNTAALPMMTDWKFKIQEKGRNHAD
jgi:hypothetical protein